MSSSSSHVRRGFDAFKRRRFPRGRVRVHVAVLDRLVDQLVAGFERGIGAIEEEEGMEGAYLLVDRANGKAITMTLWASEDAVTASAPSADQARTDAAQGAGASIDGVEAYEVALHRTS